VDSLEHILATNPPTGTELLLIYDDLMWGYSEINYQKSMDYARKCVEMAIPLDAWKRVATGYSMIGVNFFATSQYDSTLVYYSKALDAAERMRHFPEKYNEQNIDNVLSMIYGNTGNFYNMQGKYHQAIEYYQKALKIFEKYGYK
jgi:tetratricopeptide (TPR) repeat protein